MEDDKPEGEREFDESEGALSARRRETEEELTRRRERLESLKGIRLEIEAELRKISVKGALRSGNASMIKLMDGCRKALRSRLKRQDKLILDAEDEMKKAHEIYEGISSDAEAGSLLRRKDEGH